MSWQIWKSRPRCKEPSMDCGGHCSMSSVCISWSWGEWELEKKEISSCLKGCHEGPELGRIKWAKSWCDWRALGLYPYWWSHCCVQTVNPYSVSMFVTTHCRDASASNGIILVWDGAVYSSSSRLLMYGNSSFEDALGWIPHGRFPALLPGFRVWADVLPQLLLIQAALPVHPNHFTHPLKPPAGRRFCQKMWQIRGSGREEGWWQSLCRNVMGHKLLTGSSRGLGCASNWGLGDSQSCADPTCWRLHLSWEYTFGAALQAVSLKMEVAILTIL